MSGVNLHEESVGVGIEKTLDGKKRNGSAETNGGVINTEDVLKRVLTHVVTNETSVALTETLIKDEDIRNALYFILDEDKINQLMTLHHQTENPQHFDENFHLDQHDDEEEEIKITKDIRYSGSSSSQHSSSAFGSDFNEDVELAFAQLDIIEASGGSASVAIPLSSLDHQQTHRKTPVDPPSGSRLVPSSSPVFSQLSAASSLSNSNPIGSCGGLAPNSMENFNAALWPRQPNQFVFTQEDDLDFLGRSNRSDGNDENDEAYSELSHKSSVEIDPENINIEEDDEGDTMFRMDEDRLFTADRLDIDCVHDFSNDLDLNSNSTNKDKFNQLMKFEEADEKKELDLLETLNLPIISVKNRTGFESSEDFQVEIGDVIAQRYKMVSMIGEAVFSCAYKCYDMIQRKYVCLKILKNSKEYFDQGIDEIRILKYIQGFGDEAKRNHVLELLNFFYYREHLILVTELLRDNLYEVSKCVDGYYTTPRLKKISKSVLETLSFLHRKMLVHCDLKPENILIQSYSLCTVKVIDFGSSSFLTDNLTSYVQSRSYRAPEVILGCQYDEKIDIWSFGCVLAELFSGQILFSNVSVGSLLSKIVSIIGDIPQYLIEEGEESYKYFSSENLLFIEEDVSRDGLKSIYPEKSSLSKQLKTTDEDFISFLSLLLEIDPDKRPSANEMLRHKWLKDI